MTHVSRAQEIVRELLNTDQGTLSHVTREDLEELTLHLQGARERAPKRENYIEHWNTVIDIVEYGLEADSAKLRAYAELLLQKLEEDRQDLIADSLRRALKRGGRGKGNLLYPASQERAPKDHWPAMIKIVEGGLEGNPEKVRAYTELLLEGLEADKREARTLRRILEGGGNLLYPAGSESSQVQEG